MSLVLDARYLDHSLELDLSLKKLPLLAVLRVAVRDRRQRVRLAEVPAFLKLTLVLGVILALGMIWEYRFNRTCSTTGRTSCCPASFTVVQDSRAVDEIGRRLVRGPAGVPLEAVTMLSLALPVAIVGLLRRGTARAAALRPRGVHPAGRGDVPTYRKSALLAPVAVVLTIAYFRRRELLELAPLGMVVARARPRALTGRDRHHHSPVHARTRPRSRR